VNARELKDRLYARHPASWVGAVHTPGAWTVLEEFNGIDLLAIAAWSSAGRVPYARVGYEIKVSRQDLRRELLRPNKRALAVAWCNEFYFAVPKGLLTPDELAWQEPEAYQDAEQWGALFVRVGCDYSDEIEVEYTAGHTYKRTRHCYRGKLSNYDLSAVPCPACGGKGYLEKARVEVEAPTCWVPTDVGLVEVDGRGTRAVRQSPLRKEVPALGPGELANLVRWVSVRPDSRHTAMREHRVALTEATA
jgi:hypothetical protein